MSLPHPDAGTITTHGNKTLLTTANPFEQRFGYHRALRRGPFIFVSGTTALKDVSDHREGQAGSKVHHPVDATAQARVAMERCVHAVERLGGSRADVVRVRMFVSRHEDCAGVGDAFRESFASGAGGTTDGSDDGVVLGAVATMIVVQNGFVDPDILVEVEVDAIVL